MKLFDNLIRTLDESKQIRSIIIRLSETLSSQRGIPLLLAVGLILLSWVIQLIAMLTDNKWIGLCGFSLLHFALLTAFVGILLMEPLGRG